MKNGVLGMTECYSTRYGVLKIHHCTPGVCQREPNCYTNDLVLKEFIHPKMKIHLLSTHHYADGGVGGLFECTKHFESQGTQRCRVIQFN